MKGENRQVCGRKFLSAYETKIQHSKGLLLGSIEALPGLCVTFGGLMDPFQPITSLSSDLMSRNLLSFPLFESVFTAPFGHILISKCCLQSIFLTVLSSSA